MTHTRIMSAIGAGVVFLGLAGMTNAMAFVLPGIPESGFPHFQNEAHVQVRPFFGDFLLTATKRPGDFLFRLDDSGQAHSVKNATFGTLAIIDHDGKLKSGHVAITGNIPGLSGMGFGNPSGLLYFADLVDFNSSNHLLGFETTNAHGWASQFQDPNGHESLYFSHLSRPFPGFDDLDRWNARARALTTVPLPGAAFLLGSAFAALFFGASKRKAGAL